MYPNLPYNPWQSAPMYSSTPQYNTSTVLKVTGFEGAKAYPMGANQSAALFDANDNVFWLKTTDAAGFASYKAFRYIEDAPQTVDNSTSVSREEFDALKALVDKLVTGGE